MTTGKIININERARRHFDPEKLIRITSSDMPGDTIHYGYRHYDIDRTIAIQNGVLCQRVGIKPHHLHAAPLSSDEIGEMLSHFGFTACAGLMIEEKCNPSCLYTKRYYSQPIAVLACVG